jgi:cytochrome c biogenesis protein CcdA
VSRWLAELRTAAPGVVIEDHDIGLQRAKELNEALCARFAVPTRNRLVAPAVFGGGGALVRGAITPDALMRLVEASAGVAAAAWYPSDTEVAEAAEPLRARGRGTGLPLVILAGLLDGINPCAFATLIFFLSYLQLARRTPRELLQVGAAFIAGVFVTYFAIGLGLREIVGRLASVPVLSLILKLAIAGLTLVLALLNLRDGVRCRQGRLAEMTLQLPAVLKDGIHATIRGGVRLRRYVVAAFGMAVLVSVLELACTGQGYLPTIAYLWQAGYARPAMLGLLAAYNLAFVAPLAVIFVLVYRGLRSDALVRGLHRHAAAVKFATAALFLALFALLVWQV